MFGVFTTKSQHCCLISFVFICYLLMIQVLLLKLRIIMFVILIILTGLPILISTTHSFTFKRKPTKSAQFWDATTKSHSHLCCMCACAVKKKPNKKHAKKLAKKKRAEANTTHDVKYIIWVVWLLNLQNVKNCCSPQRSRRSSGDGTRLNNSWSDSNTCVWVRQYLAASFVCETFIRKMWQCHK